MKKPRELALGVALWVLFAVAFLLVLAMCDRRRSVPGEGWEPISRAIGPGICRRFAAVKGPFLTVPVSC